MSVQSNLEMIQQTIAAACERVGRAAADVNIVAVTKYVSTARALEAVEAGVGHLGENRDEGFLGKYMEIGGRVTWHYIGTLQTRKVKNVIDHVDYLHSLDRLTLAEEIEKRATKRVKCFVQVNIAEEESKHGLKKQDVLAFIQALEPFSKLEIIGLMTMAPNSDDEELLRSVFRELRSLQGEVQALQLSYAPCTELSMGMSGDYVLAIEEGATFVRIGSALVG